ncbi:uncharacterized protein LOC131629004 [Vicia villosa]|uniref:uncharacterized protein LOC131629004 n=1 Tax=Vicia villosa TaxID=3911 RepID=UPI00273CB6BD|nr:uncharacterized protein LOC131629004 [Vicia villosa]
MKHQVRDLGISSSFNSSSMKQKSDDSMKTSSFTVENLPWKPSCHCGDTATLRRSSTSKSYGKYFWGCSHFKGTRQPGCGFFEWFYEDVQDDKGQIIMSRLEKLSKKLDDATMEIEKVQLL